MKKVMIYGLLIVIAIVFLVGEGVEHRFYAAHPWVKPFELGDSCLEEAQRAAWHVDCPSMRQCVQRLISKRTAEDDSGDLK